MPLKDSLPPTKRKERESVPLRAYIALALVTLFFSGWFADSTGWLGFLDFSALNGRFGTMAGTVQGTVSTFVGKGGSGACYGFLFALSLIPGVMLALGVVTLAEGQGALLAAQRIMTPLLRPLLGLPGAAGLALISSLQSSDAGAVMTRELYERKFITDHERSVFGAFQFSSGGTIINYLTSGLALFPLLSVPLIKPLGVILLCKIFGTNLMRLYLYLVEDRETGTGETGTVA